MGGVRAAGDRVRFLAIKKTLPSGRTIHLEQLEIVRSFVCEIGFEEPIHEKLSVKCGKHSVAPPIVLPHITSTVQRRGVPTHLVSGAQPTQARGPEKMEEERTSEWPPSPALKRQLSDQGRALLDAGLRGGEEEDDTETKQSTGGRGGTAVPRKTLLLPSEEPAAMAEPLDIIIFRGTTNGTRPCDLSLTCADAWHDGTRQGYPVYHADFAKRVTFARDGSPNPQRIEGLVLARMSFDGFGCCRAQSAALMDSQDAAELLTYVQNKREKGHVEGYLRVRVVNHKEQRKIKSILARYCTQNEGVLWPEALERYNLLLPGGKAGWRQHWYEGMPIPDGLAPEWYEALGGGRGGGDARGAGGTGGAGGAGGRNKGYKPRGKKKKKEEEGGEEGFDFLGGAEKKKSTKKKKK